MKTLIVAHYIKQSIKSNDLFYLVHKKPVFKTFSIGDRYIHIPVLPFSCTICPHRFLIIWNSISKLSPLNCVGTVTGNLYKYRFKYNKTYSYTRTSVLKIEVEEKLQLQGVPHTTGCCIFWTTGLARKGNIAQWPIAFYYRMPFARLVLSGSVLHLTTTYTHNENNHHR